MAKGLRSSLLVLHVMLLLVALLSLPITNSYVLHRTILTKTKQQPYVHSLPGFMTTKLGLISKQQEKKELSSLSLYIQGTTSIITTTSVLLMSTDSNNNDDKDASKVVNNNDDKFGLTQRIDSFKSLIVGAIVGSIALAPFEALHMLVFNIEESSFNSLPQFEFDNDVGSVMGGLFAIVYRYCIRTDNNPQLNQGVIGAFVLVRTLARIQIPSYCTAIILNCGPPLGYLDYNVIYQLMINGIESIALFGATALAMNYCISQKYISKFP